MSMLWILDIIIVSIIICGFICCDVIPVLYILQDELRTWRDSQTSASVNLGSYYLFIVLCKIQQLSAVTYLKELIMLISSNLLEKELL